MVLSVGKVRPDQVLQMRSAVETLIDREMRDLRRLSRHESLTKAGDMATTTRRLQRDVTCKMLEVLDQIRRSGTASDAESLCAMFQRIEPIVHDVAERIEAYHLQLDQVTPAIDAKDEDVAGGYRQVERLEDRIHRIEDVIQENIGVLKGAQEARRVSRNSLLEDRELDAQGQEVREWDFNKLDDLGSLMMHYMGRVHNQNTRNLINYRSLKARRDELALRVTTNEYQHKMEHGLKAAERSYEDLERLFVAGNLGPDEQFAIWVQGYGDYVQVLNDLERAAIDDVMQQQDLNPLLAQGVEKLLGEALARVHDQRQDADREALRDLVELGRSSEELRTNVKEALHSSAISSVSDLAYRALQIYHDIDLLERGGARKLSKDGLSGLTASELRSYRKRLKLEAGKQLTMRSEDLEDLVVLLYAEHEKSVNLKHLSRAYNITRWERRHDTNPEFRSRLIEQRDVLRRAESEGLMSSWEPGQKQAPAALARLLRLRDISRQSRIEAEMAALEQQYQTQEPGQAEQVMHREQTLMLQGMEQTAAAIEKALGFAESSSQELAEQELKAVQLRQIAQHELAQINEAGVSIDAIPAWIRAHSGLALSDERIVTALVLSHKAGSLRLDQMSQEAIATLNVMVRSYRIVRDLGKRTSSEFSTEQIIELYEELKSVHSAAFANKETAWVMSLFDNQLAGLFHQKIEEDILAQLHKELKGFEDPGRQSSRSITVNLGYTIGAGISGTFEVGGEFTFVMGTSDDTSINVVSSGGLKVSGSGKFGSLAKANLEGKLALRRGMKFLNVDELAKYLALHTTVNLLGQGVSATLSGLPRRQRLMQSLRHEEQQIAEAAALTTQLRRRIPGVVREQDRIAFRQSLFRPKYSRFNRRALRLALGAELKTSFGGAFGDTKFGAEVAASLERTTALRGLDLLSFLDTHPEVLAQVAERVPVVVQDSDPQHLKSPAAIASALWDLQHEWTVYAHRSLYESKLDATSSTSVDELEVMKQGIENLQLEVDDLEGRQQLSDDLQLTLGHKKERLRWLKQQFKFSREIKLKAKRALKADLNKMHERRHAPTRDHYMRDVQQVRRRLVYAYSGSTLQRMEELDQELLRLRYRLSTGLRDAKSFAMLERSITELQGRRSDLQTLADFLHSYLENPRRAMRSLNGKGQDLPVLKDPVIAALLSFPEPSVADCDDIEGSLYSPQVLELREKLLGQVAKAEAQLTQGENGMGRDALMKQISRDNEKLVKIDRLRSAEQQRIVDDLDTRYTEYKVYAETVNEYDRLKLAERSMSKELKNLRRELRQIERQLAEKPSKGLRVRFGSAKKASDPLPELRQRATDLNLRIDYLNSLLSPGEGGESLSQRVESLRAIKRSMELSRTGKSGRANYLQNHIVRYAQAKKRLKLISTEEEQKALGKDPRFERYEASYRRPELYLSPRDMDRLSYIERFNGTYQSLQFSFKVALPDFPECTVTATRQHVGIDPNPDNRGDYWNFQIHLAMPSQEGAGIFAKELLNYLQQSQDILTSDNPTAEEMGELVQNALKGFQGVYAQSLLNRAASALSSVGVDATFELNAPALSVEWTLVKSDQDQRYHEQYHRVKYEKVTKIGVDGVPVTAPGVAGLGFFTVGGGVTSQEVYPELEVIGTNTLTYLQTILNGYQRGGVLETAWPSFVKRQREQIDQLLDRIAETWDAAPGQQSNVTREMHALLSGLPDTQENQALRASFNQHLSALRQLNAQASSAARRAAYDALQADLEAAMTVSNVAVAWMPSDISSVSRMIDRVPTM